MGTPKRADHNKNEKSLKNSANRTQVLCYWNATVDRGELVTKIDGKLDAMHEDKPLVDLMLERRGAIRKHNVRFRHSNWQ